MKSNIQLIPVKEISTSQKIMPRTSHDFPTIKSYSTAMKNGAKFPPILVAPVNILNIKTKTGKNQKYKGKYLLVDGNHRLQAIKINKEDYIQAEIKEFKTEKDAYIEAIKRNINHGKPFATGDKANIILTLKKWNVSQEIISNLIQMPITEITPFIATRLILVGKSPEEYQEHIANTELRHLVKSEEVQHPFIIEEQKELLGIQQGKILKEMIVLLRNDWFDLTNSVILTQLKQIKDLMEKKIK